jgi:amino acid transporter
LVLGYCVVGSICFCVMQCLGELVCYMPLPGGLIQISERFVGPAMSFGLGWTMWFNWLIVLPAELSAATILIGYWDQHTNPAIYITVGTLIITSINLLGAKTFGESEFWLTSLKLVCIVSLLILSVLLIAGVGNQGVIGVRYWTSPWTLFNRYPLDEKAGKYVPGHLGESTFVQTADLIC